MSIALILGSGPRVGSSVAQKFASEGYKVVIASRKGTGTSTDEGYLSLKADFAQPDSVPRLFDQLKSNLGSYPSVVVYNAASLSPPQEENILSIPADALTKDFNINTISPFVAAQQAVRGWETLPKETRKSFIYTGNIQNLVILPVPLMATLGMGKSASAYWLAIADSTFQSRGYRFFYADERTPAGQLKGQKLDGLAHAEFYSQLAKHDQDIPWNATFVEGKGYVKF